MQFENPVLNNFLWAGSLILVNLLLGLVTLPFSRLFFNKISDKGYSISSLLGVFVVSYTIFVLATLKIAVLNAQWIFGIVILWILLNGLIQHKYRTVEWTKLNWRQIIKINTGFIVLFGFMYLIKSFQAEIYQIERFMDYGFIKALFNSQTLPLKDIWFAGESLNYYYFSHFIGFVILKLASIPPEPGFYILTSWIFAVMGINLFRLGKDIALMMDFKNKVFPFFAGLISIFWGIFGGVLHSVTWVIQTFNNPATTGFLSGWYAEPTRIIAGTITEIPVYTYIVAELHPHMWGMLGAVLVFTLIINIWLNRQFILTIINKEYWLLVFVLGIAFMINSWDVVTLGLLSAFTIGIRFVMLTIKGDGTSYKFINLLKNLKTHIKNLSLVIFSFILIPVFAVGVALPWDYFFQAPVSGVGRVKDMSNFVQWFSFWGQFVIVILLFIYTLLVSKFNTKYIFKVWKNILNANEGIILIVLTILTVIFFWMLMEVFYIKDILLEGEWYRANTFFKITSQLWIWLSIITGPMIVYILKNIKGWFNSKIMFIIIWLIFSIASIYPFKTILQGAIENKPLRGIDQGLNFWRQKYPYDYEAYLYLEKVRSELPSNERMKVIIEAEGDSYKDNNYFSTFLGWQAVVGWPVHEWTWRGSYDAVGARRSDVIEVYTGGDIQKAKDILEKYKVDYIIVGQIEKEKYNERINLGKILELGELVFDNGETRVIKIK